MITRSSKEFIDELFNFYADSSSGKEESNITALAKARADIDGEPMLTTQDMRVLMHVIIYHGGKLIADASSADSKYSITSVQRAVQHLGNELSKCLITA